MTAELTIEKVDKVVSGVYIIMNTVSRKFYIGSSINVHYRWVKHKRLLKIGKHHNSKMQNAYNKYGVDTFEFDVLEYVSDKTKLLEREQYWINFIPPIFNIFRDVRKNNLGVKTKQEVLDRLSVIRKGKKHSEETKIKARERMMGNKYAAGKTHEVSQETRDKISKKIKGTRHSDESYKRAAESKRGKKMSVEARKSRIEKLRLREKKNNPDAFVSKRKFNGEMVHSAKLKAEQVVEIRKLYSEGVSGLDLADKFGVFNGSIYKIVNGLSWKHL